MIAGRARLHGRLPGRPVWHARRTSPSSRLWSHRPPGGLFLRKFLQRFLPDPARGRLDVTFCSRSRIKCYEGIRRMSGFTRVNTS